MAPNAPGSSETPELILHNGQILTVDQDFTIAGAVATTDGDIVALGTSEERMALTGPNTGDRCRGRTVMPGFVDPFTHHLQNPARDLDGMRDGIAFMLGGMNRDRGRTRGLTGFRPAESVIAVSYVW